MKALDLFCSAGGASIGLHKAGFEVTGVDIKPQKNYPFEFHQADAIEYPLDGYDLIWASPPCQKFSAMTKRWKGRSDLHPDLIVPCRQRLKDSGSEYVIENVIGAPLINPVMLCGTMFCLQTKHGNQLRRHRIFETSFDIVLTPQCNHNNGSAIGVHGGGQHPDRRKPATIGVYGNAGGSSLRDGILQFNTQDRRDAMGIDWMTGKELSQAIPPAYSEFIGNHAIKFFKGKSSGLNQKTEEEAELYTVAPGQDMQCVIKDSWILGRTRLRT